MKKGEINLSFNWIYIAVIGGLILIGGIAAMSKIRKQADEDFYFDAKAYTMNFISQLSQSPDAERQLPLFGSSIIIGCEELHAEGSDASGESLQIYPVFSSNLIKDTMLGYSTHLFLPMRSFPLIYLASDNEKFIIVGQDPGLSNITPLAFDSISSSGFGASGTQGYYKSRFFTFSGLPDAADFGSLRYDSSADISVVKFDLIEGQDEFPDSFGKATYHKLKNGELVEEGAVYFIDRSTLLASAFSENDEFYYCSLGKVFQRLNNIITIEKARIAELSGFENAAQCDYSGVSAYLDEMREHTEASPSQAALHGIYSAGIKIKDENRYLERLGCPQLY